MSPNRIRPPRRNHYRIALALVLVVVQTLRNIPPANNKLIARALAMFVSLLRVAFDRFLKAVPAK